MTTALERQCARMVMVGFPGTSPDEGLKELMRTGVFGAVLFKRNLESAAQVAELCAGLKSLAQGPFLLGVDQEGGRVARLRGSPFTALPPMREVGRREDPAYAEAVGRLLAYEVRAAGFDWDFAPVVDVDTNPKNPVIGDRAFHADAQQVSALGVALARGLEAGGVASCAKHFPGHGDTQQDSHLTLPRLPHGLERLRQVELAPFAAYARAGLAAVMTAHVVFEALDPGVPATMSARVLQGLLRDELGFDGVLVSDDLEMKAIAENYPVEEATVRSAQAGVDLFLVCHQASVQRRCIEALVRAVEDGTLPRARVEQANARLNRLAAKFFRPAAAQAQLGDAQHRALVAALALPGEATAGFDPTERA